jgi:transaldolase/glucose-6-phosphate isomerase
MSATVRFVAGDVEGAITKRLAGWQDADFGRRLWERDPTLWFDPPRAEIENRLGWLDLPETSKALVDPIEKLADEVSASGIETVLLLGMGGSSLAPEVFHSAFGGRAGMPRLTVLDSTHPDAVLAVAAANPVATTLYVVASKSGATLETMSFLRYFWQRAGEEIGDPGGHFVAITDPGTPLETLGAERGFRAVFAAPPDVGGRFSALSPFGLVPAGLIGTNVDGLLDRAAAAARSCGPDVEPEDNPGLVLGAALGELAGGGLNQVTVLTAPELGSIGAWIEQLFAESTGKDGTGLIPFSGEPGPDYPGTGRVFLRISLEERAPHAPPGAPTLDLDVAGPLEIGAAMFVLEIATAAAGAVLGIHPFDQPDVELAKNLARRTMAGEQASGEVDEIAIDHEGYGDRLRARLAAGPGDFVGIHAYLAPTPTTTQQLGRIREVLGGQLAVPTALDYGPRFLHSTGQLHKGGPGTGVFVQIVDHPQTEVPVPETDFTFSELIRAQAIGDHGALSRRGRRVTMVCLGDRGPAALPDLIETLEAGA